MYIYKKNMGKLSLCILYKIILIMSRPIRNLLYALFKIWYGSSPSYSVNYVSAVINYFYTIKIAFW